MLHVLLESAARGQRRTSWAFASAALHATVIGAATVLTMRGAAPAIDRGIQIIPLVLPPQLQPSPPVAAASRSWEANPPSPHDIRVVIPDAPPIGIPNTTPALSFARLDSISTSTPHDPFVRAPAGSGVFSERAVDRTVIPRPDNPQPEYPSALRSATVEGTVLVQFVVDSAGRVERHSISILRATHPLFAQSAERWLGRTRYAPAQIAGQAVRQLVQQEIAFTLRR